MKKNHFSIAVIIALIIICIWLIGRSFFKQADIKKNQLRTKGKIIKFVSGYKLNFGIIYEYHVNNVLYSGQVGVSPFTCDDGTKYCIGKEFTMYYSSKNPQNSRIDLGKYEKYKNTVEFVK